MNSIPLGAMESLTPAQTRRFATINACIREGDLAAAARHTERSEVSALPRAKALRAVAMYRSGNCAAAHALCAEALEPVGGAPCTDARTLAAVGVVWRPLGMAATLAAAYDAAAAARPDDEELAREAPLAYAHAEDWKKCQSSALRAYKATRKPLFVLWAAFAIHVTTAGPEAAGEGVAPLPLTGGGRRLGADQPPTTAARPLAVAEMLLARALDTAAPASRDAELLGLYFHSLVRLGRAGDAYMALVGKYAAPMASSSTSDDGAGTLVDGVAAAAAAPFGAYAATADAESIGESSYPFADGLGGRGRVPSTLQPVDALRLAAYLLTEAATAATSGAGAESKGPVAVAVAVALDGAAVGSWCAARDAYGALLERVDAQDWATHCGLAYAWSREAAASLEVAVIAGGDAETAAAAFARWLAPVSATDSAPSGCPGVDQTLLRPSVLDLLSAAAKSDHVAADDDDAVAGAVAVVARTRGSALSVIQLQAARCELSSRLLARANAPNAAPALITALPTLTTLSAANDGVFGALVCGYLVRCGSLACAASDLRPFLPPLIQAPQLTQPTADARGRLPLQSFLTASPAILAVPFSPTANSGCASDMASLDELFTWSFATTPAARTSLVAVCERVRAVTRPDAALRDALHCVLARAEDRSAAARVIVAKGAGTVAVAVAVAGAGAAATSLPVATSPSDPHGINAVLTPTGMLGFEPADAAVLKAARARVRRYASALQVLRLLAALGAAPAAIAAEIGGGGGASSSPSPSPFLATSRLLTIELTDAWAAALPLNTAAGAVGGEKDVGEADEIALLASHILVDVALAHLLAARLVRRAAAHHRAAARAALLETLVVLAQGAAMSPHNAQFALASLRVHTWLGSNTGVFSAWVKLRVRHTLTDVLAHTLTAPLLRLVWPEQLRASVIDPLANALRELESETPAALATALRGGHASAALDVLRFRARLRNSATGVTARSTAAALHFAAHSRSPSEAATTCRRATAPGDAFFADTGAAALLAYRDNEDRELPAAWEPPAPSALAHVRLGAPPSAGRQSVRLALSAAVASGAAAAVDTGVADATAGDAVPIAFARLARDAIGELGEGAWGEVAAWRGSGSTGGVLERLLRRAARDVALATRSAVFAALAALHDEASTADREAGAAAALARVDRLLAVAGLGGSRVAVVVAAEPSPSPSASASASSRTVESGGGLGLDECEQDGEVASDQLMGEWAAGGSLPILDGGMASARRAARAAGARALRCGLYAAKAACAAARGGEGAEAALAEAADDAAAAAAALADALKAATANGLVEFLGGGGTSSAAAAAAAAAAATATATATAIDPRTLAELSFLLFTVAPAVGVSLGIATRAMLTAERGSRGGGKGGRATPPQQSAAAAAKRALTALGTGAGALARALDGVITALVAVRAALDADGSRAIRFVLGEWDAPTACWSPTVAAAAACVDWSNKAEYEISDSAADLRLISAEEEAPSPSSKSSKKTPQLAYAATTIAVPPGPGRDWLVRVQYARSVAFTRAFRDPLRLVCASYTVIFDRLKNVRGRGGGGGERLR